MISIFTTTLGKLSHSTNKQMDIRKIKFFLNITQLVRSKTGTYTQVWFHHPGSSQGRSRFLKPCHRILIPWKVLDGFFFLNFLVRAEVDKWKRISWLNKFRKCPTPWKFMLRIVFFFFFKFCSKKFCLTHFLN